MERLPLHGIFGRVRTHEDGELKKKIMSIKLAVKIKNKKNRRCYKSGEENH